MTDTLVSLPDSTLSTDGFSLPALGYGTWQLRGDVARRCVEVALDAGYRHIDTAQLYANEREVGQAIAASSLDRDQVFVTTKIWRDSAAPADVEHTTAESLSRLGLEHVDLLLLHWPAEDVAPLEATLAAMNELRDRGMTRHIGVSNFPSAMLDRACDLAPVVNDQVEHHPYLSIEPIRAVAGRRQVQITAYCPIARGQVADDPVLRDIGEEHGVSPVQVTLRWLLQRGICPLPRSSSPERIRSNGDVFGFALDDDEIARIDALDRGRRLVGDDDVPWDRA